MCALASRLEAQGIATTTIGLVRPHMETSRPPRGLWVPFQLGRPLGEPDDASFQRRVVLHALQLLERADGGPVILEEFPDDPPSWRNRDGWRPGIALPSVTRPAAGDIAGWTQVLGDELALVRPHWEAAQARFGRTMVGVSGQAPQAWPGFAAQYLGTSLPASPVAHLTPPLAIRHLADDLKALYAEAIQAEGEQPSSRQINAWFWGTGAGTGTVAADLLRQVRLAALDSSDNGFKAFGGRFLVPAPYV